MKRLGIFVFYDANGIVDDYIIYLLQQLKLQLKKLVFVVNGTITEESLGKVQKLTEFIYIRKNIGYDGGAYKDVLINYLAGDVSEYDQLILCNDTFYGPFSPFKTVFDKMADKPCDFWGLTRYKGGGQSMKKGNVIPEHIQGYFLVINKKMLSSSSFLSFFNTLKYSTTYREAVEDFEVRFTTFFNNKGFSYNDYAEILGWITRPGVNYNEFPDELIEKYSFPVLKKKALNVFNFYQGKKAFDYIKNFTSYDEKFILHNWKRTIFFNQAYGLSFDKVTKFYKSHHRTFIFGDGKIGKSVKYYFEYKGYDIENIITSKNFLEISFLDTDGIIIALGRKALSEVNPLLKKKFNSNQLLIPQYNYL